MSNNIQYINPLSSRRKDEEDEEQNLLFDVKEPVSSSYSSEEDTVKVKNNLQKLGYYETPSYGMTPYADDPMFEGIKKLQKDHGLTVDGRITPGDETAAKISEKLSKQIPPKRPVYGITRSIASDEVKEKQSTAFRSVPDVFASDSVTDSQKTSRVFKSPLPDKLQSKPEWNLHSSLFEQLPKREKVSVAQLTENRRDDVSAFSENERFNRLMDRVYSREGGYEDRPHRIDQPTNMGITQSTLDNFKRAHPELAEQYPETVRDINKPQSDNIYQLDFYRPNKVDKIENEEIAEAYFDFLVNHSPDLPRRSLQEAINEYGDENIEVDGIVGSQTIEALNRVAQDPETAQNIINYINDKRIDSLNSRSDNFRRRYPGLENRIRNVNR